MSIWRTADCRFLVAVLLTLSNTVQNALIGNETSLLGGVLGATALLGANYVMVRVLYRNRKAARWLPGKPVDEKGDGGGAPAGASRSARDIRMHDRDEWAV